MFDNHYMKKYYDISIMIGGQLPLNKKGIIKLKRILVPYAVTKRHHLITNQLLSEELTGYRSKKHKRKII